MVLEYFDNHIELPNKDIPTMCVVRNELNGWRAPDQVLWELNGHPSNSYKEGARAYQPRPFPPGLWKITDLFSVPSNSLYYPWFIKTDAHQLLEYWDTMFIDDSQGGHWEYDEPSGISFDGSGYGLHFAWYHRDGKLHPSRTTLGCINVRNQTESLAWIDMLANYVKDCLEVGDTIHLRAL